MVQVFNDALQDRANRMIDQAIAAESAQIAGGLLSFEEYKRKSGVVSGLNYAKQLIDKAKDELMRR